MNAEPRTALEHLIAALERHFEAAASGRGDEDPAYVAAYRQLIDAFEAYDDALYDAYGVDAAFLVYDDDEDDLVDVDADAEEDDLEDPGLREQFDL
ncbi:MAG: hypothetical protein LBD77_04385 [Bifidobacteriaceae bacterium]|jgi:hypothetical protein|nr:hypothetical protein [Bifidobacteriaceae bacterium]